MFIKLDKVSQVAIVVEDLKTAMKHYWEDLGVGPWKVWSFNPSRICEMTFHGEPSKHSFRIAEAMVGDLCIELIEHIEGETIYKEFLEKKGEGLHHLKYIFKSPEALQKALEKFKKEGIGVIQSGKVGKGSYNYLDTEATLGFILEVTTGRPDREYAGPAWPPDEIYPPESHNPPKSLLDN